MQNNNYPPQGQPYPSQNPQNPPYPPQPYPGQPYQPYPPQPKQPMDPAKKKKLILGFSIGGGVLVLGILAAIFLPMILRIDYSEAYNLAGDLKTKVQDIYNDYNCEDVIDDTDSSYTSAKSFNSYIESCRNLYDGVVELADRLGGTAGVSRDNAINERYNAFRSAFDATIPDAEKLDTALTLRQAWHNFVTAKYDLGSYYSQEASDSDIDKTAKYLIDSGNDDFKAFGETWANKAKVATSAYKTYSSASYSSGDKYSLYEKYSSARTDLNNYVRDNQPDLNSIAPLDFNDPNKMYSEYNKFYELLRTTYQENYNSGTGDCTELFDEVYCD